MRIKRFIVLISTGVVLTFSSCGNSECSSVKLNDELSFHSKIIEDDKEFEADFKREGGAGWKAVFTQPETIKGMEVDLFNNTCTINYKGLTHTVDRKNIPKYSMILLITSTLDNCISNKVKCQKSGDRITEEGTVDDLAFTVKFQGEKLKEIDVADILKAEIS